MSVHKTPKADLRRTYTLFAQVGMVLSLLVLIAAVRAPLHSGGIDEIVMPEQELVQMEEIQQTKQIEQPPPPPKPPVPVEVPDDEILEDDDLDLDASLDIDEPLADLPPPPPPKEEVIEEPEPEFFVVVEEMPEPIGGMQGLHKKINYPPMAKKAGVEGRVTVQFIVDEEGIVRDPVVLKGIGAGCDQEALKAVLATKFKPGKQRGKAVRVKMSLPVTFKLR